MTVAHLNRRHRSLLAPVRMLDRFNAWARAADYTGTAKWLDQSGSAVDLQRGSTADGVNTNAPTFSTDRFTLATDDYFEGPSTGAAATPLQLLTATGLTAVIVYEQAVLSSTLQRLIGKQNTASAANNGWRLSLTTTSGQVTADISDGTTLHTVTNSGNLVAAAPNLVAFRWNPATSVLDCIVNGVVASSGALTVAAGTSNARPFRIGATGAASPGNFLNASVLAWGVAPHWFSDSDLALVFDELGF